jgi:mono/diheme cytochrome c family protein
MNRTKKTIALFLLAGFCGIILAVQGAGVTHAAQAGAGDAAKGKQLFVQNCMQCHNTDSKETLVGPGLQGLFKGKKMPATGRPVSAAVVKSQIRKGGNGMTTFGDKFSPAQLDDIVAYLKTL